MTKSELLKLLAPLNDDALVVILMKDWEVDHNGNLSISDSGYTQFEIADVLPCSQGCHAELLAGEITGSG